MITLTELKYFLGNVVSSWVTSTAYTVNQFVTTNSLYYKCIVAHTSGVFATDLAASKWVLVSNFTVNDAFLTTCIDSAIDYVNNACNRDFRAATYTEYLDGSGKTFLYTKNMPLQSSSVPVSVLEKYDEDTNAFIALIDGSGDTIANSVRYEYTIGKVILIKGYTFGTGESNIKITYTTAAHEKINLVKEATTYKAARMFYSSCLGQSFFALTSKNLGGQSAAGMGIESEADFHKWLIDNFLGSLRIQNV